MDDDFIYYEFAIDSLDATASYSGSAASTDWPFFEVAAKGPLENIAGVKIIEAQIPFSWHVFNSSNNTFLLTEAGIPFTVTIPIGNYTAASLATVLQTALNTATATNHYVVTLNTVLGKFVFRHNLGPLTQFSFTFGAPAGIPGVAPNSGNKNPRLYIGFGPGTAESALVSGRYEITAPNHELVSGPNYIYVNSSKLGSDLDVYLPAGAVNLGGGKAGPQVAKIPVNVNPGGVIQWQDPAHQFFFAYDQLQSLNSFDFYLTLGNTTSQIPLQLNGLGFSLKLAILERKLTTADNAMSTSQSGRVTKREGPKRVRSIF